MDQDVQFLPVNEWVSNFQLFLFDFDGLLVDTERLHFAAYLLALKERGFSLDWSFSHYCSLAHLDNVSLKNSLIQQFSELAQDWDRFYQEKKECYLSLLQKGNILLMPGAEELLLLLKEKSICRCVVTHSPLAQVLLIRSQLPVLETIPYWITREDYKEPKPHPECYEKAISLYGKQGGEIIGFEDTIRGLRALAQTKALPILISQNGNSSHASFTFPSLKEIFLTQKSIPRVIQELGNGKEAP